MNVTQKEKIEFGDFQTPLKLANTVVAWLKSRGIDPNAVIEPSCGVGAFVLASLEGFPNAKVLGFEINENYLEQLKQSVSDLKISNEPILETLDFFSTNWNEKTENLNDPILVIGNFPWVTNSALSAIGGSNLPTKSNFSNSSGLDAVTGKANFDISEWMTIEVLKWFEKKQGHIAMLCKTAVARKILFYAEKSGINVNESFLVEIDAKKEFGASVDACLLTIGINLEGTERNHDYQVFSSFTDDKPTKIGHRNGITVGNLDDFENLKYLLGKSPQNWRSGVKHDASSVMEFTLESGNLTNGLGEVCDIEDTYLFPLMKGSEVANGRAKFERFVLVPQTKTGEDTSGIEALAPKTWNYLVQHGEKLDSRKSVIYKKNPRFSIFGIGDYSFKPYKIAICSLYKKLDFRIFESVDQKPVFFDDTVYFVSFDTKQQAEEAFEKITNQDSEKFLKSLIFWDEKRPIKTSVLNLLNWNESLIP
jgi:hypothetical protein